MNLIDSHGHRVSGAGATGLAAYEQAAHEMRCMVDDPVASIDRALAASPAMTMAHVLKGWLMLLGTEPAGPAAAAACIAAAGGLDADERERRHLAALDALAHGRWRESARRLEDITLDHPLDALALQVGHQLDYFLGDSRMLRDRIARALPAWSAGLPGWHAVLGMHAFGLEESGDLDAAERQGRSSVELEPRDSWGWHAVAHVHEMRRQLHDGIAWLQPTRATWSRGSMLAVHNTWHLALFHLDLGDTAAALALYDEAIGGPGSSVVLDLVDQSALLWRLHLRGVDVGARFAALADRWAPMANASVHAFNDLHAMIAFTGAGRAAAQGALLDAQQATLAREGDDNAGFVRDVGAAAAQAIRAFGDGDFARCTDLLRTVRNGAHRFGGSHAQRDLLDLTLIEAARRGGQHALAAGLAAERAAARPLRAAMHRAAEDQSAR